MRSATALSKMGDAGAKYLAEDGLTSQEYDVRMSSATALSTMGDTGAKYAADVAVLLKDHTRDDDGDDVGYVVRAAAAAALGNMGDAGAKAAAPFLKDENWRA